MNQHKPGLLDSETIQARSPLQELLAASVAMPHLSAKKNPSDGFAVPLIGKIVAFTSGPLVDFPGNPGPEPVLARRAISITATHTGREVILLFEQNNPCKPIIMGVLDTPSEKGQSPEPVAISLDGEQVVLSAKKEIVLRCGKASITLTRAGKVLIRGAYLLSRSSGVNRIKGGSVQIN